MLKIIISMVIGIAFGHVLILVFNAPVWSGVLGYVTAFNSILYMLDRK